MSAEADGRARQELLKTAGFTLYTDTNDRLLELILRTSLEPIPAEPDAGSYNLHNSADVQKISEANPAGASLYLAMRHASASVRKNGDAHRSLLNNMGVTDGDKNRTTRHTFANGFGDLAFPWHFAAGLANAAVDRFIDAGVLTQEQKDEFTMHDWANIIGTGWFSRLCHLMALTKNGILGTFGDAPNYYKRDALLVRLQDTKVLLPDAHGLLDYQERLEPHDGQIYATVDLTDAAIRGLRAKMRQEGKSIGCPVARFSVLLPRDLVAADLHTSNLIRNGTLTVVEERSTAETIRATQDWSAIDKTLAFFADQLDRYDEAYGTPRMPKLDYMVERYRVEHVRSSPQNLLYWPAPQTLNKTHTGL